MSIKECFYTHYLIWSFQQLWEVDRAESKISVYQMRKVRLGKIRLLSPNSKLKFPTSTSSVLSALVHGLLLMVKWYYGKNMYFLFTTVKRSLWLHNTLSQSCQRSATILSCRLPPCTAPGGTIYTDYNANGAPWCEEASDAAFIYPYTCRPRTWAHTVLYNWDYLTLLFQHGHHKIKNTTFLWGRGRLTPFPKVINI